jgi:hypothetical protein
MIAIKAGWLDALTGAVADNSRAHPPSSDLPS